MAKVKQISTVDDGAPAEKKQGYKTCGSCQKKVAARVRVCSCGHVFQTKTKSAPTLPKQPDGLRDMLIAEKTKLENTLANVDQLKTRLDKINDLLESM